MFWSLYPTKDNVITDVVINGTSKTGSNQGQNETLELFVLPVASSSADFGKSRILLYFDLSTLSASVASGDIPSGSLEFKLRMKNAQHAETVPSSFDVVVYPLSKSWDEGRGLAAFDEGMNDSGFSNWDDATSLIAWDLTGSDFITNFSGTQHFDFGNEDLEVDVTSIVGEWITGSLTDKQFGFLLKYIDAHETGSLELFNKKFFSRHAHRPDRLPRLEVLWSDFIQDDRENIHYDTTGSLYYYRLINGFPQNAGSTVFVDILDSGSNAVQTITASLAETGIYHASGVFVTSSLSTDIYRDVWFTDNEQLFTGTFEPSFSSGSSFFDFENIVITLPNLRNKYERDQEIFIRVNARPTNYKPAVVKSGSMDIENLFLKEALYEIVNDETNEVIVPFSTGNVSFSKLSYDKDGNYFKARINNLAPSGLYRVKIRTQYNNQTFVFDKGWTFKVSGG